MSQIQWLDKTRQDKTRQDKTRQEAEIRLGCLTGFGGGNFAGQVFDKDGLSPTLTDMQGGGRQPHIVEMKQIIYDDYNSVIPEDQEATPTLTTNCGASATRNGVKVIEAKVLQAIDPKWHDFIYNIDGEYWLIRIRKLLPLECWRLMNFTDEDFHKAEEVCSNTRLYAQAGNSICVSVLEGIFKSMLE